MIEPREMESRDARRDNPARFLRGLRELRHGAGLGHAELAARAHYPCDAIKAAEAGPSLPDLPVLSAYVSACGGTTAEWEERWRALTGSPASPLLTARSAGCSEAADAGARVGSTSVAADGHDPERVIAALNRVADGMAATTAPSPSSSGVAGSTAGSAAVPDVPTATSAASAAWDFAAAADAAVRDTVPQARQASYPAPTASARAATPMPAAAPRVTAPAAPSSALAGGGGSRRTLASVIAVLLVLIVTVVVLFG